jgi:hypothetical protein
LAISGYWGPLLSWIMIPFLKFGIDPLTTARSAMAISAVLFIGGALATISTLISDQVAKLGILIIVTLSAVAWSVANITPDLLLSGASGLGIGLLFHPNLASKRNLQFTCGAAWGLAYLAKAIALPWGGFLILLTALTHWLGSPHRSISMLRPYAIAMGTMLLVSLPWITTLSLKYHKPTFSTTGPIAHAIVGPNPNARTHPYGVTFHTPEKGRITSWEDPSHMEYGYWSPFDNQANFAHQTQLVIQNSVEALRLLNTFDLFILGTLGLIIGTVTLVQRLSKKTLDQTEQWPKTTLAILSLIAIYLLVYLRSTESRYFYPIFVSILITSLGSLKTIFLRFASTKDIANKLAVGIICTFFGIPALASAQSALLGRADPATFIAEEMATRCKNLGITGSVAGSARIQGNRTGLYLAYFLEQPWFGDNPSATGSTMTQSGAQLLVTVENTRLDKELAANPRCLELTSRLFDSSQPEDQYPIHLYKLLNPPPSESTP